MKNFLLLSNYAPKEGFVYPNGQCPVSHRVGAHERIKGLERYWDEPINWQIIEAEKYTHVSLEHFTQQKQWDAIWLSGSPFNSDEAEAYQWIQSVKALSKELSGQTTTPVIGICFGVQLMAQALGGTLSKRADTLHGEVSIKDKDGKVLVKCFTDHEDYVNDLPPQAKLLGVGPEAMPYLLQLSSNVWGIQPHPEHRLKNSQDQQGADRFWRKFFNQVVS
jgi:GMP synthase-like glutamine amidotransferase